MAASASSVLSACGGGGDDDDWFSIEGLAGRTVHRLRPDAGGMLALTDSGLHQRVAGSWEPRGLPGRFVHDLVAVADAASTGGRRWLASHGASEYAPTGQALAESRDQGRTWTPVPHNFGGPAAAQAIRTIVLDPRSPRIVASGIDCVAGSADLGRTWTLLGGQWEGVGFGTSNTAILVDPSNGDIWWGGQNAIEQLILSRRHGVTGEVTSYLNLMPSPSVAKSVRRMNGATQPIVVAGEGGLVQTLDRGATWTRPFSDGHNFYFDVVQDPQIPARWVTARWLKEFDGPQRLHLRVSQDQGQSWRVRESLATAIFGGAWSLAATVEQGQTVYYLGLFRGGVARVVLD